MVNQNKYMEQFGHIKSNLRLTVGIRKGKKVSYHYDIGIKAVDDPQNKLSSHNIDWNGEPRFLEDHIKESGIDNVFIHDFGKYIEYEPVVNAMLNKLV